MSTTTKKIAQFIGEVIGWRGNVALYFVDPPMRYEGLKISGQNDGETSYVLVSAVVAPDTSGPETYIFPATSDGEPINMLEMDGSLRGVLDHKAALSAAGYVLAPALEVQ